MVPLGRRQKAQVYSGIPDFDFPPDLGRLQKEDSALKQWFRKVTEVEGVKQGDANCLEDVTYVVRDGLLYQRKGKTEALALPEQFRLKVMELGHSIPWAGHMGFQKTLHRIGG